MSDGAMVPQTGLKGTGVLVPVVGPDGGAKTRLIATVARSFSSRSGIVFPASIKAAADIDTTSGKYVSQIQFETLAAAGAFAVTWAGSGGPVGLPVSVFDDLGAGHVVVVNVSRQVVPQLRARHFRVHVIYLTSPGRGHGLVDEDRDMDVPDPPVTVIDFSGPLSEAADEFLGILQSYVPVPH